MGYLNSYSYDDDDFAATAQANGTVAPPDPSWSSGLLSAPFRGLVSGVEKGGAAVGAAVQSVMPSTLPDQDTGPILFADQAGTAGNPYQDYSNWSAEKAKEIGKQLDSFANPSPATQGAGARMAQGVTEAATLGVAGGVAAGPAGAAALLGGAEGYSTYDDLKKQGIDEDTAREEGLLSGAVNAAGAFVPMRFAGSGLLTSLLTGAGVNVALGAAQRGATGAILQAHGYDQMASQYKVFDWNEVMSDAVLGTVFGGFGKLMHVEPNEVLPEDVAQAQAIQSEVHQTRDGALGLATDPTTEALHAQTAQDSLEGLALHGEVPDIQPDHADLLAKDLVADPRKDDAAPQAIEPEFLADMPEVDVETMQPGMRPEDELEQERAARAAPEVEEPEQTAEQLVQQPGEQAQQGPQISAIHQEMLSQLEAAHGDLQIDLGDGQKVSVTDVRQLLADNGVQTQNDAALHDVAAACFLRG